MLTALDHVAHLLPDQGPLSTFVHHNTLHALQHLPFHEAVQRAREIFGAEPYLSEARYRALLESGRITERDLDAALDAQFPDDAPLLHGHLTVRALRKLLLRHGLATPTDASLHWRLSEGRLLETEELADEAARLWSACLEAARALSSLHAAAAANPVPPTRRRVELHRTLLLEETGHDAHDLVIPELIRLCAAYLDQGLAHWPMPQRALDFYEAVRALLVEGSPSPAPWQRTARTYLRDQLQRGQSALLATTECLEALGVDAADVPAYLEALLLSLPGWAGLMHRLSRHAEERPEGLGSTRLLDLIAVWLTLERAALTTILERDGGRAGSLKELYVRGLHRAGNAPAKSPEQIAYQLFQVLRLADIPPEVLAAQAPEALGELRDAIDRFDALARRRVFQEAYEHHYRVQFLSALSAHRPHTKLERPNARAPFQVIACFDEREESFRRALEELEPRAQTFGAPGFFGVPMRFQALDDTAHVALAPVAIRPVHLVEERPRAEDRGLHEKRLARRKRVTLLARTLQRGSRSLLRGMLLNAVLGAVALFPLIARILSPRLTARVRDFARERWLPALRTELTVHHEAHAGDCPDTSLQRGLKPHERAAAVATVLENIGLVSAFGELVLVLGHGATSHNNPHRSAYECGACGGRKGGPNARAFCQMANEPDVRAALRERGIEIPNDTWFVAGQHDTCNDEVVLYDRENVPAALRHRLVDLERLLDAARAHNARERCRRLPSAPVRPAPRAALRHVAGRAEHLAEPRPELGHATNAVAVVGRRALTRGLFLDRRTFLISYDPTIDSEGRILERILAGALPVGAGINLEYYFSHVDNERYGAGSKLPHNVTGLVGVMSGHQSDLRTGLPRQMIELHEPMRLLSIVEATPERLLQIAARQPEVRELVVNRWVQLVSCDPDTGALQVYSDEGFVPFTAEAISLPRAASSYEVYRGQRGYLPPAQLAGAV